MNYTNVTIKRIVSYVFGLFFLSLGVSFSIQAGLGVSPVSSLAYAFALVTGLSVGIMTIFANIIFILFQALFNKKIKMKEYSVQLIIAFLFGFFMDATLYLVQILPFPASIVMRIFFLLISLIVVPIGLLGYLSAKLPLMPYDALTYAISNRFNLQFSKAKISSDLVNVFLAGAICVTFIQTFGSIGIGTIIAAYCIGKILGYLMKFFQQPIFNWINNIVREDSA
nr:DUF6198 family protein [Lysinibacillus timonensis]